MTEMDASGNTTNTANTALAHPTDRREQAFQSTVLTHLAGMYTIAMCYLGDRLGLFRNLAERGPATSSELAQRTALNERYVRDWLRALASAGYLAYNDADERFLLPPEHRAVLAEENHPRFLGGWFQLMTAQLQVVEEVALAFRHGGGVAPSAYPTDLWDGEARISARGYRTLLVQDWIPRMPVVAERLARGATVADVGCGEGQVLLLLAQAYPKCRFLGLDPSASAIARAREQATAAGIAERVTFREWDDTAPLPQLFGQFDVITTFTVVHDAAFPLRLLRHIHDALQPDGIYVCRDVTGKERFDPSGGIDGVMSYAENVLYCMTTARAAGGEGLGQLGLTEALFRQLCQAAAFREVQRIPPGDSWSSLYVVTP